MTEPDPRPLHLLLEPLTATVCGRPTGSTRLRLPLTLRIERQQVAFEKSTRSIPSVGEDYDTSDEETGVAASTAPGATDAGTRGGKRCGNCGELVHYRNTCKKRKADCI